MTSDGGSSSVNSVFERLCFSFLIDTQVTTEILRLLESGRLRELCLYEVSFANKAEAIDHITAGLYSTTSYFQIFEIEHWDSFKEPLFEYSGYEVLLNALTRLPSLSDISIRLPYDAYYTTKLVEAMNRPECQVRRLTIQWDYFESNTPHHEEPSLVGLQAACPTLKKVTVNLIAMAHELDLTPFDFSDLLTDQGTTLQCLEIQHGDYDFDVLQWLACNASSSNEDKGYCNRLRRVFVSTDLAKSPDHAKAVTEILRKDLPFLYDIKLRYGEWMEHASKFETKLRSIPDGLHIIDFDFDTGSEVKASEEDDEKILREKDEAWRGLWAQLECNYVGMGLLSQQDGTFPPSMWPLHLAKIMSSYSCPLYADRHEMIRDDKKPWTGLYLTLRMLLTSELAVQCDPKHKDAIHEDEDQPY